MTAGGIPDPGTPTPDGILPGISPAAVTIGTNACTDVIICRAVLSPQSSDRSQDRTERERDDVLPQTGAPTDAGATGLAGLGLLLGGWLITRRSATGRRA